MFICVYSYHCQAQSFSSTAFAFKLSRRQVSRLEIFLIGPDNASFGLHDLGIVLRAFDWLRFGHIYTFLRHNPFLGLLG